MEAEGEIGGGELGEGFNEDGGDGVVAGEVRVELVSVQGRGLLVRRGFGCVRALRFGERTGGGDGKGEVEEGVSDRANIKCRFSHAWGMSGNRKRFECSIIIVVRFFSCHLALPRIIT